MRKGRRGLLGLGLASALAGTARGQDGAVLPDRPLRLVVPTLGGAGTADTLARIVARAMDQRLPQRMVVENRAGANGNVGAAAVARSVPDGATLLWGWAGTLATNPALYRDLPFDPVRDFDPVVLVGNVPNILVVPKTLGPRSLAEFTAMARADPGQLHFGSTGNGSSMHLAGELYRQQTGTELVHVPYSGAAPAATDLLSGRIQAMFNLLTGAGPQIRAGEVVPLAVLSDRRVPQFPDVPTTAELGLPGLVFGTWFGVLAPRGAPPAALGRLNALFNDVLADPEAGPRLQEAGLEIYGGPPERLAAHLAEELRRHATIVRASGARLD